MKIGNLTVGIDFKRCDECEYKNTWIRDNELVTSGARAAYLDDAGVISIPGWLEGEDELAAFIRNIVNRYYYDNVEENFDMYIETELIKKYGKGELK